MKNETVKGKYKSGKRGRGGNLMEMRREKERRNVKAKERKIYKKKRERVENESEVKCKTI